MAGNGDIKVLGAWPSPFAVRPRIALQAKEVDYVYVEENLASKSDLLINSNPIHKKVPVLIHNGKCISESLVIVEYIDEAFSGISLLPSDAYDPATARFWAAYIDTKVIISAITKISEEERKAAMVIISEVIISKVIISEEERKAAMVEVTTGLGLLEEAFVKMSEGKGFFGGATIGYLDIALGSFLVWIEVTDKFTSSKLINEATTPGLYGWAERFVSAAAVKDVLPDAEKLKEFAVARFGAKAF